MKRGSTKIDEILRDLDIDMKARLTEFSGPELRKLLQTSSEKMNKQTIGVLLCNRDYFEPDQLLKSIEKMVAKKAKLLELLDEPKDEKQMREPVATDLRKKRFKVAYEVPLPKGGRSRARKVDVAGYKKGVLGGLGIVGVELKSKPSTAAIDTAFGQAKDYSDWCEESIVCFSPLVYLKYAENIKSKMRRERKLGVWIVSKKRVVRILQEASAVPIPDKKQREMMNFIESGRR